MAGGKEVSITESTDYPFREQVRMDIRIAGKKARFPLTLRIPAWSRDWALSVNGKVQNVTAQDGICTLDRTWKDGDVVLLELKAELTTESWYGGAWSFVRGPLLYALGLEENWQWNETVAAWEVTTESPWNYCIMRDSFRAEDCTVTLHERSETYPWNPESAPVRIDIPARVLPHWQAYGGSTGEVAYWTEDGYDVGEPARIQLIPYGCTTLRIAEFPTRIVPWDIEYKTKKP